MTGQARAAEWQPIATAPKDGEECWLAVPSYGGKADDLFVILGWYDKRQHKWLAAEDDEELWPPVKWMQFRIPEPPAHER